MSRSSVVSLSPASIACLAGCSLSDALCPQLTPFCSTGGIRVRPGATRCDRIRESRCQDPTEQIAAGVSFTTVELGDGADQITPANDAIVDWRVDHGFIVGVAHGHETARLQHPAKLTKGGHGVRPGAGAPGGRRRRRRCDPATAGRRPTRARTKRSVSLHCGRGWRHVRRSRARRRRR